MEGLPSAESAAYSEICENSEQRMENPQWKGFPQFADTVDLIRVFLTRCASANHRTNWPTTMIINLSARMLLGAQAFRLACKSRPLMLERNNQLTPVLG